MVFRWVLSTTAGLGCLQGGGDFSSCGTTWGPILLDRLQGGLRKGNHGQPSWTMTQEASQMAHPGRHLRRVFGVKSWCFTRLCKKCWMRTTILGGPILAVVEPRAGPYILKSCCIPLRPSSQQTDPLPKRALCLKSGTTCRLKITGHVRLASETMFGKPLARYGLSHKYLTLSLTWGGQGKIQAKKSYMLSGTR